MNIDNNTDLMLFINQEKQDSSKISPKKVYIYFYKCLQKTIVELDSKFMELTDNERHGCVINGTKMFFYVFFLLVTYSNNLKLTIFLAERALLLYSEFIIMSRDKKVIEDYYYKPNINDAITFAYKQTIGPLEINELKTNEKLITIRECASILIEIYNKIYLKYNKNIGLFSDYVEIINDTLVSPLLSIFNKTLDYNDRSFLLRKLFEIINNGDDTNIETILVFIKIFVETLSGIIGKISGNLPNLYEYVYKTQLPFNNGENSESIDTKSLYSFKKTKLYLNVKNSIKSYKSYKKL